MTGNILGIAYLVLGGYWAYHIHRKIFAAYGTTRLGRFAAYTVAALLYFGGIGMMDVLTNGGWHRIRGSQLESHTDIAESLTGAIVLGLLIGAALYARGEMDGGTPLFSTSSKLPEFPDDFVAGIVQSESDAPAADREKMAKHLLRRSRKSGEELPAPLAAFVKRNLPNRYLS